MDDKVGGLEVKYVFNREKTEKTIPFHQSISDTKEENPSETQQLSTKVVPYTLKDDAKQKRQDKDIHRLLVRNTNSKESDKPHDLPLQKIKFDDKCDEPGAARGSKKMTDMPSLKAIVDRADKGEKKVGTVSVEKVENKVRKTTPTDSDKLLDQPLMRFKSDDNKPPNGKRVELEVAYDSKRFKEMSSKKSMNGNKSKHEDESPADVNNLEASGTSGTIEDRKKRKILAKETSDDLEGNKLKKTRNDDGSFKVPTSKIGINTDVRDSVAISKGKSTSGIALDIPRNNKNNTYNKEGREEQSGESNKEFYETKSLKASTLSTNKVKKNAYREFVISPKPIAGSRRWFTRDHWEDKLKNAYKNGTAILLHNVDPDFNSGEVEGIISHAFNVNCDAEILQRTSVSSPHYAQAIIVLKTKEAAQRVLTKLDEECWMFSNGRNSFMPLVGTPCPLISTKMHSGFFGHFALDKARSKKQGEDKAVSTSHFSQPNTIEYEMAMEWRLLQLQSLKWWEKLHEQQGLELENLKNDLNENVDEDS
ncbi:hypothetical protein M8C21_017530 [Ambrosia artemisiifolia]|uniref:Uncharacterized protein n=1 Tax=Ambrosia artemisiifolia TaxID=4212 RepID=A0AAD5GCH8_AMBAR|nr:hypothetical protein M8C21_017530 [Ambrosia artemisiifolia]